MSWIRARSRASNHKSNDLHATKRLSLCSTVWRDYRGDRHCRLLQFSFIFHFSFPFYSDSWCMHFLSMFWPNAFDTMNSFYLFSRDCFIFLRRPSDADVYETGKELRNYNKFNGIQFGSVGEKKKSSWFLCTMSQSKFTQQINSKVKIHTVLFCRGQKTNRLNYVGLRVQPAAANVDFRFIQLRFFLCLKTMVFRHGIQLIASATSVQRNVKWLNLCVIYWVKNKYSELQSIDVAPTRLATNTAHSQLSVLCVELTVRSPKTAPARTQALLLIKRQFMEV